MKMRPGGPRPRYRVAVALWLTLATVHATAQVSLSPLTSQSFFSYQAANRGGNYLTADGGLIYTDNVERTANGTGETLLLVGLTGNASRDGPRLDYHLDSNIAVLKYLGGAYPTRPTGYLDGMLMLKIVPSLLSWVVRETYTQVPINQFAPSTPNNLQSVNYITTGPRITLRPTLRTTVTLDALYSDVSSSSSAAQFVDIDSRRYGGDLKIDRAFSEAASLYLEGHYEKVDFNDDVKNNDFSIGEASLGYRHTDGRTVFDVSGGYSQLRLYDVPIVVEGPGGSRESTTTEEFDNPIWALKLSRLITPSQRLALHASQRFTDVAAGFRLGFDQPVPIVAPTASAASAPYKQNVYGLDWHFQASRTALNVSFSEVRQRYVVGSTNTISSTLNPPTNVNMALATVFLTRRLSPVLTWNIGASYERTEQVGSSSVNGSAPSSSGNELSSSLVGALTTLHWQVGERLALQFIYAYSRQSGAYKDNQVGVIFTWALLGAHAPIPALSPLSPASTRAP